MRFFRSSDLNETRLKQECAKEFEFVEKALSAKRKLKKQSTELNLSTFCNLYHVTRRFEYVYFSDLIADFLNEKESLEVLDVGCGVSYAPYTFSAETESYVGIDLHDLSGFYENLTKRVKFLQHDITESVVEHNGFDLVISISVLEHIPPQRRLAAFRNMASLLKPGGVLAVSFDVDLEAGGAGFTFDEVIETICVLKEFGLTPTNEVDLTPYSDIVTTEQLVGLPKNRYQLAWRLSNSPSFASKILAWLGIMKTNYNSLAVVFGSFVKT